MAARVVARARLAFNWEAIQYDRPSYGYYIWYRNITNNSVQAAFPCAEIKAQLQQFDASIQLADNDDPDHDSIIWTEQGFTRPFPRTQQQQRVIRFDFRWRTLGYRISQCHAQTNK